MASHEAAGRAVKAGYNDVSVMPEGIEGWKNAGKPVELVN
jgi:rhodanese-related sulfurtransferase